MTFTLRMGRIGRRHGILLPTILIKVFLLCNTVVCINPFGSFGCSKTQRGNGRGIGYNFVIATVCFGCFLFRNTLTSGILSSDLEVLPLMKFIKEYKLNDTAVRNCFEFTSVVNLNVQSDLNLKSGGWTDVKKGMNEAITTQAHQKSKSGYQVIVGPFYRNLAMVFENMSLPYIATDYIGFDWIDSSLVRKVVNWGTLVEILPPAEDINKAIVDLFAHNKWLSVVVILPDDPKENQVCQDLITQMIKRQISPIAFNIENSVDTTHQLDDVLRSADLLEQKNIIVCSPRDDTHRLIDKVLKKAKRFGLMEREDHVIFLLDTRMYLEPLKEMAMYRERLYTTKCLLLAYRYKFPGVDPDWEDAKEGAVADAAKVIVQAQKRYLTLVDDGADTPDSLSKETFLRALKEVSLPDGKTGNIMFNKAGQRVKYKLQLYSHGGLNSYNKYAEWTPDGAEVSDRLKVYNQANENEENEQSLFKDGVRIAVVMEEPFVMVRSGYNPQVDDENDKFEGFTIDLIKEIAKLIKMNYKIYMVSGNAYGSDQGNGNWNGMVGDVISGNATLGMGAISITSEREKVVDFSLGIMSTGMNMLVAKPKEQISIFQFMKPFSLNLWMGIVGSSVIVSILYLVLDFAVKERQFTIRETIWFTIGTLLMRGTDFSPERTSQRVITAGFTFFVLITVSTYTAKSAAFMTTTNLERPVSSLEDLAERDDIKCGVLRNSATLRFFQKGEKAVYRKIWNKIKRSNGIVYSSEEGRNRSRDENFAYIYDFSILSYFEKRYCETKMVGSPIRLMEHGIVMKPGATFKTKINIALLMLKEKGRIRIIRKKWWDNKQICDLKDPSKSSGQVEFTLMHMAGVFIVGACGVACSVVFFLLKRFYVIARTQLIRKDKEGKSEVKVSKSQSTN